MKKFLLRLGLFMLPLALAFVPAIWHLEFHRELESDTEMAMRNQEDGVLIGLAYTDPMHVVKHRILQERQPEVIALGTSRVLPFRSFYFRKPSQFYNCGRTVDQVQDFESFLLSYPGNKPRLIILGLDQDFFGVSAEDLDKPPRTFPEEDPSYGSRLVKGTKALFDALEEGDLETGTVLPHAATYIGCNARLYGEGFRRDGSYLYARSLFAENPKEEYSFSRTIELINENGGRFASAERVNPAAVRELGDFIRLCKSQGIHVVAFLPPYAHKVYLELEEDRPEFPHVFKLHAALQPVFRDHGYRLFDFSDLKSLGSNDYETYDGFHASETAFLKLIRIMAEKDPFLAGFLNKAAIDGMIANAHSARQVIEEIDESNPERPASGE